MTRILAILAALLMVTAPAAAQGTVAPVPQQVFFTAAGAPCASCLLYTYAAGTTTPLATYSVQALTPGLENTNPIVLNTAGRNPNGGIYLSAASYKFVLKTAGGLSTIYTQDNVGAVPTTNVSLDVTGIAGEALSAGDVVYLSTSDGHWFKADADAAASSTTAKFVGMVQSAIASGDSGSIRILGRVTGLTALSVGSTYYASGTAGALTSSAPANARVIGVADSTTTILIDPNPGSTFETLTVTNTATMGGTLGVTGVQTNAADLAFSADKVIRRSTSDASDNGSVTVAGGGASGVSRGGHTFWFGNENSGSIINKIGNVAGAKFQVNGNNDAAVWLATNESDGATTFITAGGTVSTMKATGAFNLAPRASAPASAASGDLYVDSTPNPDELCFYDGAAWQGISSGVDANCN